KRNQGMREEAADRQDAADPPQLEQAEVPPTLELAAAPGGREPLQLLHPRRQLAIARCAGEAGGQPDQLAARVTTLGEPVAVHDVIVELVGIRADRRDKLLLRRRHGSTV